MRFEAGALRRGASSRRWATSLLAVCITVVVVSGVVSFARADTPIRAGGPHGRLPVAGTAAPVVTAAPVQSAPALPSSVVPSPPPTEPPTTAAPPSSRSGAVFIVGDSLTVGTEPWLGGYLQSHGWRLAGLDARVGRGVDEGLAVLQAHSSELPDTVMIALGTNDLYADPNAVGTWLRRARAIVGGRRLVWVNLCLDDRSDSRLGSFRRINAALGFFAPSDGVELADWCSFSLARGVTPGADGIHYLPAGYRLRAAFYAGVLSRN